MWYVHVLLLTFITEVGTIGNAGVITLSHPLKLLLFGFKVIFARATVCNCSSSSWYMYNACNYSVLCMYAGSVYVCMYLV